MSLRQHLFRYINQIASSSDVPSLNCALRPETHHLVNKELLHLMPKHALLINISRRFMVDKVALAHALHNGIIFASDLNTRIKVESNDEIGMLIQAYNSMAIRLKNCKMN